MIYFLQAPDGGTVKIGDSADMEYILARQRGVSGPVIALLIPLNPALPCKVGIESRPLEEVIRAYDTLNPGAASRLRSGPGDGRYFVTLPYEFGVLIETRPIPEP